MSDTTDTTNTLYSVYAISLVAVLVILALIYMEIDGRKIQQPSTTSEVRGVRHEQHAGDTTEYRGNGKAVSRRSSRKRRGRNARSVVHSSRRVVREAGAWTKRSSVHRRHDRSQRRNVPSHSRI